MVDRHPGFEFAGIDPHERTVECRIERFLAAEDLHLALFGFGPGMKAHLAVAEQHEAGDALVGVGDEHRAGRKLELEVFSGDRQVVRVVLLRGVEYQTVEAFDGCELVLVRDSPRCSGRGAFEIEAPRRGACAIAGLLEHVDDQLVPVSGQRTRQRHAVALLHYDELAVGERLRAIAIGRVGKEREVLRG